MSVVEKILQEDNSRFVIFPIQHDDIWQAYKKAQASFWTAEEIDLSDDLKDWNNKLNDNERHYIKNILAFFAASDGLVNENLCVNFMSEVQYAEARCYYGFQLMMENIHGETYSLLIDTYIKDKEEKEHLFNALETIPSVKKKGEWAMKWINSESFVERLIAFAVVEGIFFSSSFASIFYMKKRGLLPGLSFANELISNDENSHKDFACLLYNNHVENKLSQERIYEIIEDAIAIEKDFVSDSLPVSLIGMNSGQMCQYLEYVADDLLVTLGCKKLYNATNPFDFMELIAVDKKNNFFENRNSQYTKAGITTGSATSAFNVDDDF
jgi:ribonucleoside-diphosphate reductase beta chain